MKSIVPLLSRISFCFMICAAAGCSISKQKVHPVKTDPGSLQQDLILLNKALQKYHPSLYAFCPKTEWEEAWQKSLGSIRDSLNEADFAYQIVGPLLARIRCGHTSVSLSNYFKKYQQVNPPASFPLHMKFFGDTMMVSRNLNRTDTQIKKGTIILTINGMDSREIKDRMFANLPMEGYAESVNLARLNNNFPFYHRMVMGVDSFYAIQFQDDQNLIKSSTIAAYKPGQKTKSSSESKVEKIRQKPGLARKRELRIDTISRVGYMFLANFNQPLISHHFIRKSFKTIKHHRIKHLIIDLRSNGGGVIDNEVFLARHLRNTRFRVADSAVAINRKFNGFRKYFQNDWINGMIMCLFTQKDENGLFHLSRYWEKRQFKPVHHRFFDGQIYILTGGMTFSAASLFCKTMKGQDNVLLIGEETGGSGYANNGLLIPDFRLPNSGVKIRMPLFRLVPDSTTANDGRGVIPDIVIKPSSASFKQGYDPAMTTTLSIIRKFDQLKKISADLK